MPDPASDRAAFAAWQATCRAGLRDMLGIPHACVPLEAELRSQMEVDDLVLEKWVFSAEPDSAVPAVLYRPRAPREQRMPAIVMTFGHGGSKSAPAYCYTAQLFAKLGFVCLTLDPIGEEERHIDGCMGTRAHDPQAVHECSLAGGRLIMGKLVWDTMRGIDLLLERDDVDPARLGVSGNSLGGAKASWMAALDTRLAAAIVSGWAYSPMLETYGKFCTRVPIERMRQRTTWPGFLALAAPHCAMRIVNGTADVVIDKNADHTAWRDTDACVAQVAPIYETLGKPAGITTWYEPGGGHRPYPARKQNLAWLVETLKPAGSSTQQVQALDELNFGDWCRHHNIELEKLYGTPLHLQGATVADMNVAHLHPQDLAVLTPAERGSPRFTLEGWLANLP